MSNLTGKTLGELRAMSQPEIATAMGEWCNDQTKKQLIEFEMDATEFTDKPEVTHGEHGILTREQVVRDALGDVLRVEETAYSYYDGGEVDEITIVVENAGRDVIEDRLIKHYRPGNTGGQPEGHYNLTVVLTPQDVKGITAPWRGEYWRLVDVGDYSLWAVDAPASVLLDLHAELWAMSPTETFGVLAVASARGNWFLKAAVRHHAGMTGQEALARRNRVASYLDGLGHDTTELRAAMDEAEQMAGIVTALDYEMSQLWTVMRR